MIVEVLLTALVIISALVSAAVLAPPTRQRPDEPRGPRLADGGAGHDGDHLIGLAGLIAVLMAPVTAGRSLPGTPRGAAPRG